MMSQRMSVGENPALTLGDPDLLGQRDSGTVVILVNNNHGQCRRAGQSGTSSVSCRDDQPLGQKREKPSSSSGQGKVKEHKLI